MMTEFFSFDNQRVVYNPETKIIKTAISEPFYTAGKILNWHRGKTAGLGLNQKIVDLVILTKSTLIVHVESSCRDYFLKYDRLKQFMENYQTSYRVKGNNFVRVIAWDLFTHELHRGVSQ